MRIAFTKMEGIGNDYIYVEGLAGQLEGLDLPELSRRISDRHFGVGSDGLIAILPAEQGHDFRMRMWNADGSEGRMCGNGMRCFARYVYDRGLTRRTELAVETLAGVIRPELLLDDGRVRAVRVDMGQPILTRADIPMLANSAAAADSQPTSGPVLDEPVQVLGRALRISAASMGNPHAVIWVDRLADLEVTEIGPALERHPLFPERVNVHVAEIVSPGEIRMKTWERGSGVTLACGTGACAVTVLAHLHGFVDRRAVVHLPGGDLEIVWESDGRVFMTGPAREICRGTYDFGGA